MADRLLLQRLRFFRQQPSSDPFFQHNNLDHWRGRGSATYWSLSPGAGAKEDAHGVEITAGGTLSSDTFFNAFHASYWRKWTILKSLSLQIRFTGRFLLQVFRHTDTEESVTVLSQKIGKDGQNECTFGFGPELPPGVRFSFSLTCLEAGARFQGGGWYTTDEVPPPVRLGIVIATYSRPESVERLVRGILDDPELKKEDLVIRVADQGENPIMQSIADDRLRLIRQANLGTGGFSRAIYESVQGGQGDAVTRPTHILILDDDIDPELDSLLRAIRLAQFARQPFLIGGTMLDLYQPNVAIALGEFYERHGNGVYAIRQHLANIDVHSKAALNAMAIPCTAGYCAWWFCMMPTESILKIGLPLPLFVRGEDIQYGGRAKEAGYPACTIPGLGVWHQPFYARMSWWIPYMDGYNYLMLNSQFGLLGTAVLYQGCAEAALQAFRNRHFGRSIAVVLAMEDYLKGWKHFKERTFPAYFQHLRAEIARYEEGGNATEEEKMALTKRVEQALRDFQVHGAAIQREFAAKLPKTVTFDSWKDYFVRGNLTALPD